MAVQDALLDDGRVLAEARRRRLPPRYGELLRPLAGPRGQSAVALEDRNSPEAPAVNPYNWQDHIHDKSQPENLDFLKRLRALLDRYPGQTTVGEIGDGPRSLKTMAAYTSGGDKLHMCYTFDFLSPDLHEGAFRRSASRRSRRSSAMAGRAGRSPTTTSSATSAAGPTDGDYDGVAKLAAGDPPVAARLGLPLSGRGTRPDRGRHRLRGSAGSLRHPLLAGIQGPRRLPHADGVGIERHLCRLLDRPSRGCRCRRSMSRAPPIARTPTSQSVLAHYRAHDRVPPCPSGAHSRRRSPSSIRRTTCSASSATRRRGKVLCALQSRQRRRSRPTCRPASRSTPLEGHGFTATLHRRRTDHQPRTDATRSSARIA